MGHLLSSRAAEMRRFASEPESMLAFGCAWMGGDRSWDDLVVDVYA